MAHVVIYMASRAPETKIKYLFRRRHERKRKKTFLFPIRQKNKRELGETAQGVVGISSVNRCTFDADDDAAATAVE